MRLKILTVAAVIILIVGIGFLLFAPVSNFLGQKKADAVVDTFEKTVDNISETVTTEDGEEITSLEEAIEYGYIDEEGYPVNPYGERVVYKLDLDRLLNDSLAYNKMLLTGQGTKDTIQYSRPVFDLKTYGISDSIYCYITIDAIGMRLPVYLGANDTMMSYGAAHLYGTSLPVGEESTNCAVAGHTGYIGRIFFDNIRRLKVGDTVTVTTYWDNTDYKVIGHKTIKPDESDDLLIQDGRQLLTLITCVSDGNDDFDRYLVICEKSD